MSPIDRPIWATLNSYHASISVGGPLARRFQPQFNVFGSPRDDSETALAAFAALVEPGERVCIMQAPPVIVPPGLAVDKWLQGVQMIATRTLAVPSGDEPILTLGEADAAEMFTLARLTEPGPFMARTHSMGRFVGIRLEGRLAAMAGERFRFPGHTEVSAVCTHPDFRGRGFARRLTATVAAGIQARGEQPFLQAWKTNEAAIALYASLGFVMRAAVDVVVLEKRNPADSVASAASTSARAARC